MGAALKDRGRTGETMRHVFWAAGALNLLLLCQPEARADKKEDPPKGNWLSRLFGGKTKPAEPGKEAVRPKDAPAPASARIQIQAARDRYLERVKVCDKLRAVAQQTNDDGLERRAEQIEARAWDAYQAQLGRLSGDRPGLSPEEQIRDHLGIDAPRGAPGAGSRPTVSREGGIGTPLAPAVAGRR